jgi:para-aminobenzoate synthetase component 1
MNSFHGFDENKPDNIGFPALFFFTPQHLLLVENDQVIIRSNEPGMVYNSILETAIETSQQQPVAIHQRLTKEQYIEKITQLQKHIVRGDCYEINFCQEFLPRMLSWRSSELFRN